MDLKISQQFAQVGLNIQKPQVQLNITMPRENVKYNFSEVNIHSPDPKLRIDQTQCWLEMDARNPGDYGQYCVSKALSTVKAGIDRRVQEGESLGAIDKGGTVAGVIASRVRAEAECQFNIAYIPESAPQVKAELGQMELNAPPGGVSLSLQRGEVENNAPWAKVEMYLNQKPSIDVQWVGSHVDAIR